MLWFPISTTHFHCSTSLSSYYKSSLDYKTGSLDFLHAFLLLFRLIRFMTRTRFLQHASAFLPLLRYLGFILFTLLLCNDKFNRLETRLLDTLYKVNVWIQMIAYLIIRIRRVVRILMYSLIYKPANLYNYFDFLIDRL